MRANWIKYGKRAGHIRNMEMADYADAVMLYPGGVGTDDMYSVAKSKGLRIFDYRNIKTFKFRGKVRGILNNIT